MNQVSNDKEEIKELQDLINRYIAKHWSAKEITPEIGLEHWLFIQQISTGLAQINYKLHNTINYKGTQ